MLNIKIFIMILNIYKIISLQNPPDIFLDADSPYRDDIQNSTEKYHHIITAVTARWNGYVDYYKGIYYKKYLYCHWINYNAYHAVNDSTKAIPNYKELRNINDTNLKDLHSHGCAYKQMNILFDYRRSVENALISITLRLTNILEKDVTFNFGVCQAYEYSTYEQDCKGGSLKVFDSYNITNNSFLIYTFRFTNISYYVQSDNFEKKHSYNFFNSGTHLRFFILPDDEDQQLYLNSYIISVDLFKYILSLAGHAHNYCQNKGCLDAYSCQVLESNGGKSPKYYGCEQTYYGYFYSECSLFGCIPGSFCNPDNTCIECDYQCRTCFDKTYMNCKSCYSIAIYPYWM